MISTILSFIIAWSLVGFLFYVHENDIGAWPTKLNLSTIVHGPLVWYTYAFVTLRKKVDQTKKDNK